MYMLRRYSLVSRATARSLLLRRPSVLASSRARHFATCPVCRGPVPTPAAPAARAEEVEDSNFVDIDLLMGLGAAAVPAHGSSAVSGTEVLGVVRVEPVDEGVRYSRLQIPIDADAAPSPRLRSNTRAGLAPGEAATYADTASGGAVDDAEASRLMQSSATEEAPHSTASAATQERAGGGDGGGRLPDPARLPYDDERFAEMLLEMEVNGVMDEAWQDARTAQVEDVKELAGILTSMKVRDLCCIDVSEKTSNFDYMMFGTCEGARHIHLAAWAAQDADKVHRISKIKRKQTDELWEVVAVGRIVVNLMVESFREEMTLERKWAVTRSMDPLTAANAPISEGRQVKAHGLWTLTLNLQDLEDFEVDYCKDMLMRQM